MQGARLERRFEATFGKDCRLAINNQRPIRLGPQRSPHEYHVFAGRADTLVGNQRRDGALSYAMIASPRNGHSFCLLFFVLADLRRIGRGKTL